MVYSPPPQPPQLLPQLLPELLPQLLPQPELQPPPQPPPPPRRLEDSNRIATTTINMMMISMVSSPPKAIEAPARSISIARNNFMVLSPGFSWFIHLLRNRRRLRNRHSRRRRRYCCHPVGRIITRVKEGLRCLRRSVYLQVVPFPSPGFSWFIRLLRIRHLRNRRNHRRHHFRRCRFRCFLSRGKQGIRRLQRSVFLQVLSCSSSG